MVSSKQFVSIIVLQVNPFFMELLLITVTDVCVGDACVGVRVYLGACITCLGNIWPHHIGGYIDFFLFAYSCCMIQYTKWTPMCGCADFTFTPVVWFHILFTTTNFFEVIWGFLRRCLKFPYCLLHYDYHRVGFLKLVLENSMKIVII